MWLDYYIILTSEDNFRDKRKKNIPQKYEVICLVLQQFFDNDLIVDPGSESIRKTLEGRFPILRAK